MAKILIVDDSPTEIYKLTSILQKYNHSILVAENGSVGIELAIKELPDVILMDIVMPNFNGFQATRKLTRNETTKDIPIIIVTTKDQETDKVWGCRQGARDYLTKPIDERTLVQTVNAVLNSTPL